MLPGGVDEYLERRASGTALSARAAAAPAAVPAEQRQGADGQAGDQAVTGGLSAKELRDLRKELNRLERQLDKLGEREARLHADMAGAAGDFTRLAALDAELREVGAQKETVELEWMELAERLEGQ
ncbi:hypothetical protein F5972_28010 [Microbispora cellulosiformans]|uniref:ABC transporter Uup C-terminal domain-containing protein n=1 Tax=Microbispora cellulosiformans TaxID=2614688 RepID=A0A5J5JVG5_9ACTN|nr:hypothetical protein F5972_28010 [Microbispora cellulosiformans]